MTEHGAPPKEDAATRRRLARMAARQSARAEAPRTPAAPTRDPLEAKPGREDIIAAYRWLLGRPPEDEGVITRLLARIDSGAELRGELLHSSEFRERAGAAVAPGLPHDAPPMAVAATATPAALEAELIRLRKAWARLGEIAPHWSCLPEPAFRPERIAANRRAFLASGRADRALVEGVLARHRIAPDRLGRLVDFGCGVGRATLHLAAICPEITGVDISTPHLALARAEARSRGMDHIAWLRSRPDRAMPAEGYGLWFSRRVLQHVPPPLSRQLLSLGFAGLQPGGVAVFQLLTHGLGYGYDPAAPPPPPASAVDELHALPQEEVFALAEASGLRVLDVQEDPAPGLDRRRWVSHLFVMARR
jgi:SAM-dependent methyltransferase